MEVTTVIGRLYGHTNVTFGTDGVGYWALTACCGASAKGAEDATVCRSCYQEIDSLWGSYFTAQEFEAMQTKTFKRATFETHVVQVSK